MIWVILGASLYLAGTLLVTRLVCQDAVNSGKMITWNDFFGGLALGLLMAWGLAPVILISGAWNALTEGRTQSSDRFARRILFLGKGPKR